MRLFILMGTLLFLGGCVTGSKQPAPYKSYGLQGGADSAGVHTVSSGDTIWNISRRYRLAMQDVIIGNNMRPPYNLKVGQRIKLPPPQNYKVQAGDTLYNISRTFNVSMSAIARLNLLKAPYQIHPDDNIRLPSKARHESRSYTQTASAKTQGKSHAKTRAKPVSKAARAKIASHTPKRAGSTFAWPVDGPMISSYGPKKGGLHNDGINIKAKRGAPVKAAENGVVVYAGRELEGFGQLILIRHANRWMSAYAHLGKTDIKRGQEVRRGQVIGKVGSSGGVDSPQLHFEVRRGTKALNPEKYLASRAS